MDRNYFKNTTNKSFTSYESFDTFKSKNNFYIVPKHEEQPMNIETILERSKTFSFTPQREGLSPKGFGQETKLGDKYFFQKYIEYGGKFYYPYIDKGIYYFPYFFQKKLYYYPFSATDKCFCEDENLEYKISVGDNIEGRCIPCYQCANCNMDYYYMCQNIFPMSG
jgi:hypothetical protein